MPFGSRSRFPRTGVKRKTAWGAGPSESDTPGTSAAATFVALWATGSATATPGLTQVRIRGHVSSWLTGAGAIGDGYRLAFGIRIVSPEAFAVGITAMPTPFTDIGDDGWLYHNTWDVITTTATPVSGELHTHRFEIDSKAMRKIPDEGYLTVGVMEGVEIGGVTVEWTGKTRILDKLA